MDECEPLKPGQTVKVRVLSLTRALLPRATTVIVTMKDPQSFAMVGTNNNARRVI